MLSPQKTFADVKAYCSNEVERAINLASPDESEMMRAGDQAFEKCSEKYSRIYGTKGTDFVWSYEGLKQQYEREKAEEAKKVFGERTLTEAFGFFVIYGLLGMLLCLIPVIGIFVGGFLVLLGSTMLVYTSFTQYPIISTIGLIIFAVPGLFMLVLSIDERKSAEKRQIGLSKERENADIKRKAENAAIAKNSGKEVLLKKCIASNEPGEFSDYLQQLDDNEYQKISSELISETIQVLGKAKFLDILLMRGYGSFDPKKLIAETIQQVNVPVARILAKNKIDFNIYETEGYIAILTDNYKKSQPKGVTPFKKNAVELLSIVLKNTYPAVKQDLMEKLEAKLGDDFKYIENMNLS